MNSIEKEILKNSSVTTTEIESSKAVLLLENSNDDTLRAKRDLGFDESIKEKEALIGKNLDIQRIKKENGDKIILQEDLINFCLNNNYYYDTLDKYKGPVPNELVDSIQAYCKEKQINLSSASKILYILAPLSYFKTKNVVKMRDSKDLQQIIILDKITEQKHGGEIFYSIIKEEGKRKPIKEFLVSLFKTHPKQINHLSNTIAFLLIALLINIPSSFIDNVDYIANNILFTITILVIIKLIFMIFIPNMGNYKNEVFSFNVFRYNGISDDTRDRAYDYNIHFISDYFRLSNNKMLLKKNLITSIGLTLLFIVLSWNITKINVMSEFYKSNTDKVYSDYYEDDKYYKYYAEYTKTGIWDYKRQNIKIHKSSGDVSLAD